MTPTPDKDRAALADEATRLLEVKYPADLNLRLAWNFINKIAALRTTSGHGGGTVTEDYDSAAILATGKRLLQRHLSPNPAAGDGVRADVAPLREQIAAAIDPLSFALDYETRHRHCSPYKIEYAQQQWFERADAVIALLTKNGLLASVPLPQVAGEPVSWRWRYRITKGEGWSRWIPQDNETISEFRKTQSHNLKDGLCEVQSLYAAPLPSGRDAVDPVTVEACAKIAERGTCQIKCASPDCLTAKRIAGEIRALSQVPASTPATVEGEK